MELTIAEITDAEVKDVVALWERCNLTRPWNDPFADIARARQSAHSARQNPYSAVLVGQEAGKVVASVMVGHDGHRGRVYYLAVEPSLQNAGRGRAMMEAAEAWLKQRGVPKLQLMIRTSNGAVRGFYEALGFSLQDTIVYGKWIDGRKD